MDEPFNRISSQELLKEILKLLEKAELPPSSIDEIMGIIEEEIALLD